MYSIIQRVVCSFMYVASKLLHELFRGKCVPHMYKYGFRLPSVLFKERYVFSPSQVELGLILFSMHACLIISNNSTLKSQR